MAKLGFSLIIITVMLLLVPLAPVLALHPAHGSGLLSVFFYMFGHANLIHWAFNSWCLLMLHNVLNVHRCIASYISTVLFGAVWSSFPVVFCEAVPCSSSADFGSPLPILGFSAVIFWFWGYMLTYFWRKDRFSVLLLSLFLIVGLFIPHIAGSFHVALFFMGFVYYRLEGAFRRFIMFISDDSQK